MALVAWALRLRSRRFDLAIDPRGEFPHAVLMWLAAARRRVGWAAGGGGFLLSDSVAYVPGRSEYESRRTIVWQVAGGPVQNPPRADPGLRAPPRERLSMQARLDRLGHGQRPVCVIHTGAGSAAKRWPIEHWRELVGRLVVEADASVVLVGAEGDRKRSAELLGILPWPNVSDWTGQLSLAELAALVELASVFVGADSGPAHLAAALGAPTVVLFSGTNSVRQWQPRGLRVRVLAHDVPCGPCHRTECTWIEHPCLRRISPDRVYREVVALWNGDSGATHEPGAGGAVPPPHLAPDPTRPDAWLRKGNRHDRTDTSRDG
jgi:ADP-heptose:LPS heptosyltransferase